MATPRTDKIYRTLKADGTFIWFRYSIDDNGAYQFVFQTGTSGADQAYVTGLSYFQNVLNYPGATTTTGDVMSGIVFETALFGDGSAAAPSITFANQINLGFYRALANTLGFASGGTASLLFGGSGAITAGAANSDISLTPNGTGAVSLNATSGGVHLPSTNTGGLQLFNTVDQVTNYERFDILWTGNVATMRVVQGGTGTIRSMQLGVQTRIYTIATSAPPFHKWDIGTSGSTGGSFNNFTGTSTAVSGTINWVTITPTYNQVASTAANTDLLISRTETSVGSGAQYLIQAQVGGVDRFAINNNGGVWTAGGFRAGGSAGNPGAKFHVLDYISGSAWGTAGRVLRIDAATATDTSTAASGTVASAVFSSFAQPTLAATNTGITTTDAATVYIANAPVAGVNQTITNPYALWIDNGMFRYDGTLSAAVATSSTHKVAINIGGTVYYALLTDTP